MKDTEELAVKYICLKDLRNNFSMKQDATRGFTPWMER
jgi:hypothetical protein